MRVRKTFAFREKNTSAQSFRDVYSISAAFWPPTNAKRLDDAAQPRFADRCPCMLLPVCADVLPFHRTHDEPEKPRCDSDGEHQGTAYQRPNKPEYGLQNGADEPTERPDEPNCNECLLHTSIPILVSFPKGTAFSRNTQTFPAIS